MVRNPFTVLGAATIVAALGLSGCSTDVESKSAQSPVVPSVAASAVAPPADSAPLPAPEALTDVMYRLADPAVPGKDKMDLVENTTADEAGTIDKIAAALRDNGYTP